MFWSLNTLVNNIYDDMSYEKPKGCRPHGFFFKEKYIITMVEKTNCGIYWIFQCDKCKRNCICGCIKSIHDFESELDMIEYLTINGWKYRHWKKK